MSQKSTYAQQPTAKIAPTVSTTLVQDPQSLANHNDLTQHFVTNGPSNAQLNQFAQPVFIPTSSGLLLTAALPTMLTSRISNLQPISQSPMATATLHSVNGVEKSPSIAVSIEKRSCINMQIPQPTLAVTLPPDNNLQSNFLQPPPPTAFTNRTTTNLLSSVTLSSQSFNQTQKIITTPTNPVTFSLSAPPPLCVQSKEMIQSSNHHLNLSNSQISFTTTHTNSTTASTQLSNGNGNFMSKVHFIGLTNDF